jgi:hypothetical protein
LTFTAEQLRQMVTSKTLPEGLSPKRPEDALDDDEYPSCFGMSRAEYAALPAWRQLELRKAAGFF